MIKPKQVWPTDSEGIVPGNLIIVIDCASCREEKVVVVPEAGYEAWRAGAMIQNALPNVPPAERELLISGTCGACFGKLCPEEE